MKTKTENEYQIDPSLIQLKNKYNDKIDSGHNMFKGTKIKRAFISNPNSYHKVFLLAMDGGIIEHGINPDELYAPDLVKK